MATYVSKRQRLQKLIAAVAVAALLTSVAGFVVGRASVPTVSEQVSQAQSSGEDLATRVSALTIEYEQAMAGTGDSVAAGVTEPLDGIGSDLESLLAKAKWVGPTKADRVRRLVKAVGSGAASKVDLATFEQLTASASDALRGLTA